MQFLIVTENPKKWSISGENVMTVSAKEYLDSTYMAKQKKIKVINLCNSYQYQSTGYYISLLAEARGQKPLPSTSKMMDFKLPNLAREDAQDFDTIIQDVLGKQASKEAIEFNIYFGITKEIALAKIGLLLFNLYQTPLLRVSFNKKDKWQLQSLKPLSLKDLNVDERNELGDALELYLSKKNVVRRNYERKKYDLAILVNPDDPNPPSDSAALHKFIKAADHAGFNVEIITKADYGKINHFDALFIRETTNVNHHTFRFARKAEYEGLVVIDDPNSILRCTNKVYLKELLEMNKIPTPESMIFQKKQTNKMLQRFEFPIVLKQPDGAFSKGVKKVKDLEELNSFLDIYFKESDLLIAQEFMPTDFDWRVGVLNGQVIYVCRYYMARGHWQIVDWQSTEPSRVGDSDTIPISEAPKALLDLAIKATKLIGNGLYGVDIKEHNKKFYVIEINDNPSIDSGIEDKVEKNKLYENIMDHLMKLVISN